MSILIMFCEKMTGCDRLCRSAIRAAHSCDQPHTASSLIIQLGYHRHNVNA
jgi:hypothetical protein